MKKYIVALLGAFAFIFPNYIQAACQCPKNKKDAKAVQKPVMEEITPDAGPRVINGVNLFLTADFIYWTARMDGLGYAVTGGRNGLTPPPGTPSKGTVKHPDFSFDPGFKIGLGYNMPHDGWDVYLEYTWLYTSDKTDSSSQADVATSPLQPALSLVLQDGSLLSTTTALNFAGASWDIHFNNFDFEIGRNFFVSRYLKLRPHFGLKGAWYDSDFDVNYLVNTSPVGQNGQGSITRDQDWWGVGVRTGLDTAWQFNRNWSVFGQISLASLWGQFDTNRKDVTRAPPDDTAPFLLNFDTENKYHSVKPVFELSLGLRWEKWFNADRNHFLIEAGWEEQIWWNQNQMYRIFEEAGHGDLVFQGLTIQLRFDF